MDSPCGRLLMIFILAYLFSDFARSLKNDDNPSDSKALGISRRERDSTQVKEILPVEVNVGGLVNFFNGQIQKLGDNVTRLDNQLQIIKGNEERNRAELKRSRNESKLLKEENYRLKKESTAIKAENERLKMKLEATSHETGIPQGTNGLTWSFILRSCIDEVASDQDGWILLQQRNILATSNDDNIFARMKWNNYRDGFEESGNAYWYGLQKMHEKTSSGRWKVALVFHCGPMCGEVDKCAVFNDFKVDGENEKFKLHVGAEVLQPFSRAKRFKYGTLDYANNIAFTTSDSDNMVGYHSVQCATNDGWLGGWWFRYHESMCGYHCPNSQVSVVNSGCTHTFMVMKRI